MRVVQIINSIRNPSAGPTHYVARLADELQKRGDNSLILTIGERPPDWAYTAPLEAHSKLLERSIGVSLALLDKVRCQARLPSVLHGHGIWRATNLFPLLLNGRHPARIMISPHGTLSPWSMRYKFLVKLPFWKALQKPALDRSHCYHATASAEYEDIRRVGLRGPVAMVPCGVDLPVLSEAPRIKRMVYMGRIDPIKGVDILIKAWCLAAEYFPDWELVIAGPLDNDYAANMQRLANELRAQRLRFVGQVLGEVKRELLATASLFVLPSHSENFAIAVAEALAHGLPVITTTGTPWKGLIDRNCGWRVPSNKDYLVSVFADAMGRSTADLGEMGRRGRDWMASAYSWDGVTSHMRRTYHWLLHGGRRPDWIIVD